MVNKEQKDLIEKAGYKDLELLTKAKHQAKLAVNEKPTAQNLRALKSATKMLDDYLAKQAVTGPAFPSRAAVIPYLQRQGFKVKKSKVYKDSDLGILKVQTDGRVLERDVELYIANPASRLLQSQDPTGAEDLIRRKALADCALAEGKLKELEFRLEVEQRKWIRRDLFEMELAGRLAVFEAGVKNLFFVRLADYLAAGNVDRATEMMNEDLDGLFGEYASTETFQVVFVEKVKDDEIISSRQPDAAGRAGEDHPVGAD